MPALMSLIDHARRLANEARGGNPFVMEPIREVLADLYDHYDAEENDDVARLLGAEIEALQTIWH